MLIIYFLHKQFVKDNTVDMLHKRITDAAIVKLYQCNMIQISGDHITSVSCFLKYLSKNAET